MTILEQETAAAGGKLGQYINVDRLDYLKRRAILRAQQMAAIYIANMKSQSWSDPLPEFYWRINWYDAIRLTPEQFRDKLYNMLAGMASDLLVPF